MTWKEPQGQYQQSSPLDSGPAVHKALSIHSKMSSPCQNQWYHKKIPRYQRAVGLEDQVVQVMRLLSEVDRPISSDFCAPI